MVPINFVQGHGTDKANEENGQSPPREPCADSGPSFDQVIRSANDGFELSAARGCHDSRPYWERTGTSNEEEHVHEI